MNTLYKKFDINSPFGQFLYAVNTDNKNDPFVNAVDIYPNHIVTFTNFIVTDESKKILRDISEMNIINEEVDIDFNNINLPFIPNDEDNLAVYDMYTLQDNENYRSIINFNYFYNPTITNFMKMCRIKQYILNGKIVFSKDYVFVNAIVADMLRRIRFIIDIADDKLYTYMYYFNFDDDPIVDTIESQEDLDNVIEIYGNELYDDTCDSPVIEIAIANITGDYDNESKLGIKESRKSSKKMDIIEESEEEDIIYSDSNNDSSNTKSTSNKKATQTYLKSSVKPFSFNKSKSIVSFNNQIERNEDDIETESDFSDSNNDIKSKSSKASSFGPVKRSNPSKKMTIYESKKINNMPSKTLITYNNEVLEEEDEPESPILTRRTTKMPSKKISKITTYNNEVLEEEDEPESPILTRRTTKMPSKKIGRITVYNDDVLEEEDEPEDLLTSMKNFVNSFRNNKSNKNSSNKSSSNKSYSSEFFEDSQPFPPPTSENSLLQRIDNVMKEFEDNYEYTVIDENEPIENVKRLQALWTVVSDSKYRNMLMNNNEFKKWKNMYGNDMTNYEFLIALLHNKIPLNTEDVDGIYFFNRFDVIDFMNLYNDYEENTNDIIDDFNNRFGKQIAWDEGEPFENAYPDVFDWIKTIMVNF